MRVLGRLFAALGMLAVAACGRDASAPTAAPPQPPAVVVTFASDSVRIEEGETAEIALRYRINTLSTSPLSVAVSPLNQGAVPEDYELSGNTFEIPAGQAVTGTAAISLTALVDNQIAEGEEVVSLRLQPPGRRPGATRPEPGGHDRRPRCVPLRGRSGGGNAYRVARNGSTLPPDDARTHSGNRSGRGVVRLGRAVPFRPVLRRR